METNGTLYKSANYSLLLELDKEKWNLLVPVTVFLGILMLTGIIGNCLVGYVWRTKMKNSCTNTCVLLLASFDLLTCTVGIPLDIYDLANHYTFDKPYICKLFRFLIDFCVYGSITVLVLIAIIRYVKVCRPLSNFPVSSRGVIMLSLTFGVGLAWPVLILHGLETRPTRFPGIAGQDCGIDESFKGGIYATLYFALLGLVFVFACGLLGGLYICIGYHIYQRNRRRNQRLSQVKHIVVRQKNNGKGTEVRPLSNISQDSRQSRTSMTSLMFFAITLAFILSYLPSLAMLVLKAKSPHLESYLDDWHFIGYIFFFRTYFINNSINPILYGVWNKNFRQECIALFTNYKKNCQNEKNTASNSQNNLKNGKTPKPESVAKESNPSVDVESVPEQNAQDRSGTGDMCGEDRGRQVNKCGEDRSLSANKCDQVSEDTPVVRFGASVFYS